MELLDPYMMPEYYWVEQSDLASGMQMMNMVDLNHQAWQPYPTYPYAVAPPKSVPTQLNPTAPDFSPRTTCSGAEDLKSEKKVVARLNKTDKYRMNGSNYNMKMPPVSMDLVMAANYMLNDIFGFINPQIPLRQKQIYKDDQNFYPTKKSSPPKSRKSRSPSPESIPLVKPEISYEKAELMAIAKSPLCQVTPQAWPLIAKNLPRLVRREGPTANLLIKEVRAIKKQEEEQKSIK